ncbi:Hpt domain-containing protein [Thalassotalea sp. LPB0316]|uniref:Hpt domain-containing protein n=1 Tax=Thalassotalea sp. LPB0316 TaxID=2769490 RepID=UPI0018661F66|nr:Hpt domain-containing protein [Thalassotalea sp. LPB0316]QOL26043.1 Hpt domain-containing protein [Thalassotalea sp. LPB0316]
MANKPLIDETLLSGYIESLGKNIVEQMFGLYKEQSVIYINEIAATLPDGSQQDWHERCHKFKGAASSVGLLQMHAYMVEIEHSQAPSDEKQAFVKEMLALNEASIETFKKWLDTH